MPSRGRPRAGPVARAARRPRLHAGNRVAETDGATDRVPQGMQETSWGCPFQPIAARTSDVHAGDTPDGRTTLLPLARRISLSESVGNNVKGRFPRSRGTVFSPAATARPPAASRSVASAGRKVPDPPRREPVDTWHVGRFGGDHAALPQISGPACLNRRHGLPRRMRPLPRGRDRHSRRNRFFRTKISCAPPDFFRARLAPDVHPAALRVI